MNAIAFTRRCASRLRRASKDAGPGDVAILRGSQGLAPQDDVAAGASHRTHRSFSVERPASASITEMIQNRITICGSVQPSCSKWWWIGAILKMRFPVSLKDVTCTITD